MSHFYGTVQGNRGVTTRVGSPKSGMETICASWSGAVRCHAYVDSKGRDKVRIEFIKWRGSGKDKILYDGPIGKR